MIINLHEILAHYTACPECILNRLYGRALYTREYFLRKVYFLVEQRIVQVNFETYYLVVYVNGDVELSYTVLLIHMFYSTTVFHPKVKS